MSDLWLVAGGDAEAERHANYLLSARTAAAGSIAFVLAAADPDEYQHREALMAERLDEAVSMAVGSDTGMFLDVRMALLTEMNADFQTVHQARMEAQRQLQARERVRREVEQRAAARVAAINEGFEKLAYSDRCPYCGKEGCSPDCPGPSGGSTVCPECGGGAKVHNGKVQCNDPDGCGYGWDGKGYDDDRHNASRRTAGVFDGPEDFGGSGWDPHVEPFRIKWQCPQCGTPGSTTVTRNDQGNPICTNCHRDIPPEAVTTTSTATKTAIWDGFWSAIHDQYEALKSAQSADDVMRICKPVPGVSTGEGFFEGSGGDEQVLDALLIAGWRSVRIDADYYWCLQAPNGDLVTYIEGDLFRGNQMSTTSSRRPEAKTAYSTWSEDDDEFDDGPEPELCPVCGGPGIELGTLGRLTHFRCQNCGWEWSENFQDDGRYPQADDLTFESAWTRTRQPIEVEGSVRDVTSWSATDGERDLTVVAAHGGFTWAVFAPGQATPSRTGRAATLEAAQQAACNEEF